MILNVLENLKENRISTLGIILSDLPLPIKPSVLMMLVQMN